MITDKDIARVCVSSYDPSFKWDTLWDGADTDGIHAGLTGNVLCFRGSVTFRDWFRDLKAEAVYDERLGGLHAGFAEGLQSFYAKAVQFLHRDTIVCGHSLGAARALIFTGFMIANGIPPKASIVFGCPKPGFQKLADVLAPHLVRSYRNAGDLVPDVPLEFAELPYVDGYKFFDIAIAARPDDCGLFKFHHPELYYAGALDRGIDT